MAGIYLHIPYCESKCVYCDFYSVAEGEYRDEFVSVLTEEISCRAKEAPRDAVFRSVYFGGGTPSLLSPEEIRSILDTLRECFELDESAEVSMECNPGTVTAESLAGYRACGVNRLSFGVQSFFEDDLAFLSRIHSPEQAKESIEAARQAGFDNISLDLMFSLPGQTASRWSENLRQARELGVTHLSCYSLTVELGTPLASIVNRGEVCMPVQEEDAGLFETTMRTLGDWGFLHYEVSNFARPGFECRHNLVYWNHEPYLGFGPSAHSFTDGKRTWNVTSIDRYIGMVRTSGTARAGGERLTRDQLRTEHVYLGLRSKGIDLEEFRARFGSDLVEDNRERVRMYVERGLLAVEGNRLFVTPAGFLLCDEICAEIN
ncbi:MAG: radical SAM family heme chaperone HemW [Chlorobi bacterium]|nr:radical SAM family heme chaperone HemW [Chlorobiota bacterium]